MADVQKNCGPKFLQVLISRLRKWLMLQKVAKLNKDGNKAAKGGNWPVFDFCNQFLQVLLLMLMMMMEEVTESRSNCFTHLSLGTLLL